MTPATVECSSCPLVVGFLFAMDRNEAKRLQRKVMAVAGWLVVGVREEKFCRGCGSMLKSTLSYMSPERAREVKSAIADALHLGRAEIIGVRGE